jgi:hypothetical protein
VCLTYSEVRNGSACDSTHHSGGLFHTTRRPAEGQGAAAPGAARERKQLIPRASPHHTHADAPRPLHFPEPHEATSPGSACDPAPGAAPAQGQGAAAPGAARERKQLIPRASPHHTHAIAPRPLHFPESHKATTPGSTATRRLAPPPRRARPALLGEPARERKQLIPRASPHHTTRMRPGLFISQSPTRLLHPGAHATRRLAPPPRRARPALLAGAARERKQLIPRASPHHTHANAPRPLQFPKSHKATTPGSACDPALSAAPAEGQASSAGRCGP